MRRPHKFVRVIGWSVLTAGIVMGLEVLAAFYPPLPPFTNPSHTPITLGNAKSPPLTYVVMGDSTAAGQGADYANGIAMGTLMHLAHTHRVTMTNLAISGATVHDVLQSQLAEATRLKPNLILLAIGANDVTHLTANAKLRTDLSQILQELIVAHCETRIVLTGVPDMGSSPRFAQPLRAIVGARADAINSVFMPIIAEHQLTYAPISAGTGPAFRRDHSLFASDRFHPNDRGYAIWIPILNRALDDALASQPSHCGA